MTEKKITLLSTSSPDSPFSSKKKDTNILRIPGGTDIDRNGRMVCKKAKGIVHEREEYMYRQSVRQSA
jgi:hypothetical protein